VPPGSYLKLTWDVKGNVGSGLTSNNSRILRKKKHEKIIDKNKLIEIAWL
jgi:hypothetical protein